MSQRGNKFCEAKQVPIKVRYVSKALGGFGKSGKIKKLAHFKKVTESKGKDEFKHQEST